MKIKSQTDHFRRPRSPHCSAGPTPVRPGSLLDPADPSLKYSTPIAPGVAVPDKIESSIGTLNLTYGYPSADTVEKIYDNLDRSRALQAYLMAIPVVNQAGMRDSLARSSVRPTKTMSSGKTSSIRAPSNSPPTTTRSTTLSGSIPSRGHWFSRSRPRC